MKSYLYPRLNLDISFVDLAFGLFPWLSKSSVQSPSILQDFSQNHKQVLVTLSVRTAFDLWLQALNFPKGTEVLMSAINIRDMQEIVKNHGLIPVPVDINLDTLAPDIELLGSLISQKSRVFVVAHLFGSIIDLEPIVNICQKHQILLVEDCAQAFCGTNYYGASSADVSLFSFGPIKSSTALGGAIVCIKDSTIAEKMVTLAAEYSCRSELWFGKRIWKYLGLKTLSIPQVYVHLISLMKLLGFDIDITINSLTRGFASGDLFTKIRYRPPQMMLQLLWRRLNNLDNSRFQKREDKARLLISQLDPEIVYPGSKTAFHSFWVFPILVNKPDSLMTKLRAEGFDATRGNTSLTHFSNLPETELLKVKNLFTAKQLSEQILYLPVYANMRDTNIIRLAGLINQFSGKISDKSRKNPPSVNGIC
ncbi:DegT/DnrJ/EryC1/StrS family aminotransferase [Floridanema evergladense]|uniref:DegT/DnrJ/EryC1/StrS family aminotransferase n=1 Tax=Floridaenema evergladense BLCC-F167 TaxID=3153639 RepID=A0ABV4WSE9_9CYAN